QIAARFSDPMVAFGDPHLADPFDLVCPEHGTGRWAGARNWVYDFSRDLPAGVRCTLTLKAGLRALSGRPLEVRQRFAFDTGGPAVQVSFPHEGEDPIDEDQIFILALDAPADTASIRAHARCAVGGVNERIGVRLIEGDEREQVLNQRHLL